MFKVFNVKFHSTRQVENQKQDGRMSSRGTLHRSQEQEGGGDDENNGDVS
jgi:hypothetical protein